MSIRFPLAFAALALLASSTVALAEASNGRTEAGGAFMSSYRSGVPWGAPASRWVQPGQAGGWDVPTTASTSRMRPTPRRR
jgi:hypothetical protein